MARRSPLKRSRGLPLMSVIWPRASERMRAPAAMSQGLRANSKKPSRRPAAV